MEALEVEVEVISLHLFWKELERFYSLNNHTMQSFRAGPQLDASSSSPFSQEDMETVHEHAAAEAEEESDNNHL